MEIPIGVKLIVNRIFGEDNDVKIEDWDSDRIMVSDGDTEYNIRTWNITDRYVDWTLFRMVYNDNGRGHGEVMSEGVYPIEEDLPNEYQ